MPLCDSVIGGKKRVSQQFRKISNAQRLWFNKSTQKSAAAVLRKSFDMAKRLAGNVETIERQFDVSRSGATEDSIGPDRIGSALVSGAIVEFSASLNAEVAKAFFAGVVRPLIVRSLFGSDSILIAAGADFSTRNESRTYFA